MGPAIVVRTDYTSGDVRRVAQRVKNAAQHDSGVLPDIGAPPSWYNSPK